MLDALAMDERASLVASMASIERIPGASDDATQSAGWLLRSHRPGDIGWVVSRHGALYASDYGWDIRFEALVAGIAAEFLRDFDASCEHGWIAECDGCNVGSVFVVRQSRSEVFAAMPSV